MHTTLNGITSFVLNFIAMNSRLLQILQIIKLFEQHLFTKNTYGNHNLHYQLKNCNCNCDVFVLICTMPNLPRQMYAYIFDLLCW